MKILYHHRVASKDGQYVHIEEIITALKQLGHEVIVVEPDSINSKAFGQSSSMVKNIRAILPGFMHELAEFAYSIGDFLKLRKAIKVHKPDFIYERYNLFFPSGVWAAKRYKLPFIVEVNSPLFDERAEHDHIGLPKLARWSEEYVWKHADVLLPVTQVLANRVMEAGVAKERITVIPNGINREKFASAVDAQEIKEKLGITDKKVLGFTGFVRVWHRLDRVLDVIQHQHLDGWCFLVVGDGPARKSLEEQAKKLNLQDKVLFTGLVNRDDINQYVSCFDVALQPDVVAYASPLKLFEYLALGKAVLAPDKANIREVLTHEKNAELFDEADDDDFNFKLNKLCTSSELRASYGESAKALVIERQFYWDSNAKTILDLAGKVQSHD